jgi:hypothetical protein
MPDTSGSIAAAPSRPTASSLQPRSGQTPAPASGATTTSSQAGATSSPLPTELFRFRVIRPILSQPSDGLGITTVSPAAADPNAMRKTLAAPAPSSTPGVTAIQAWLAQFSSALAVRSDLVAPSECLSLLPAGWSTDVGSVNWKACGAQLVAALLRAFIETPPDTATTESQSRLLLVFDFLTTLAQDQNLPAAQRTFQTAQQVQAAVAWRPVVVPTGYFPEKAPISALARRPGFTDFYITHDEWQGYVAGEIAAVINVLPGETLETIVKHSQDVNTLTSTTTTVTTSQMTEQQQTTSTSLSDASSSNASLNIGVQGQVQTSGQYGPTQVNTSLGAQLQISQSQSDSRALTTSTQTVQQSVKSVTQQVTTVQSQQTITRDKTSEDHKLTNSSTTAATVGIYRWLSEIHYVQMVRYPNRFVMEFEVPEPGAWLRWALQNAPETDWDNPDPGPFNLSPTDISVLTYYQYASQWQVRGLTPPPADTINLSAQLTADAPDPSKGTGSGTYVLSDTSITVPDGYQAGPWQAQVTAWQKGADYSMADVYVTVGGGSNTSTQLVQGASTGVTSTGQVLQKWVQGSVGLIDSGVVPIAIQAENNLQGLTVVVNVECVLTPQALAQWQETTFDQLATAYQTLLNAFNQERDARNQTVTGQANLAGPPELNQQRATNELRRAVIQDLLGSRLGVTGSPGQNDVQTDPDTGEPYTTGAPLTDTDTIQFFEQAFEWENLVYICYPYYWARHGQWITDAISATADPVFDQFLNAGSARVAVPARPGFEGVVLYYLYTGQIWGGGQPPVPGDPDYLSIAQEIQDLQTGPTDGTPVGSSWEITLPTTLLWAGSDPSTLPKNLNPTIPPPSST